MKFLIWGDAFVLEVPICVLRKAKGPSIPIGIWLSEPTQCQSA